MTSYRLSLIRRRRRTFLLCKETGMQKWATMLVETGKAFVDSSARWHKSERTQTSGVCHLERSCVGEHFWSSQSIHKMDLAQPQWTTPQPDMSHSREEALPIRSEHCQNTKNSRSRHWKWPRLADDDLPPSPEKNQQAKTHKTQMWPRKAERFQVLETFQAMTGGKFAPLTIMSKWIYKPGFIDNHLQQSSDWNNQWDPWQTSSKEKKNLGHCRNFWSVRQKETTEKDTIWTWRIWEIQGNEQQH